MLTFLTSLALSLVFSFLQINIFATLLGVRANFILALVVAYALIEKDWLRRMGLIIFSVLMILQTPTISLHSMLTLLVLVLIAALTDYLSWHATLTAFTFVLFGTIVFNLDGFGFGVFFLELLYNLIMTLLFYGVCAIIKTRSRFLDE